MTSLVHRFRTAIGSIGLVVLASLSADSAASPSITSGSAFPTDAQPDGSLHLRNDVFDGLLVRVGGSWDPANSVPAGRVFLDWQAGQRGKPGLVGDIDNAAEATRERTDPYLMVQGTNATSALCTYWAEGGITLTTAGASGDQMILAPHNAANQSPWAQTTWGTGKSVVWEDVIWTAGAISACTIWAGLKLTNTSVIATDDHQAFFRFSGTGNLHAVYSIAGVDVSVDTLVVVAVDTQYRLRIEINAARIARFYVNGALVATSAALTDAINLIPYTGVQAATAAARSIRVQRKRIGRNVG